MYITDISSWALDQFKFCNLGDKRRTTRLIELAKSLCNHLGRCSHTNMYAPLRCSKNRGINTQASER
ncbi:transposase DNA-binding-containing protein [Legionella sp. 31fI33]|uniref:IS4/Tn5 family transposase DNA-binding protein n=1 Tax=Legionella sp. 31fI33 TaxID=2886376 RepID=UPI00351CE995|nr:transposase [Legionella sp. 31fI33]